MPDETFIYPAEPILVEYPHPVLRKKAAPVTIFDDRLRAFCQRMFAVMDLEKGVGLAAPQVAVSKRIFITEHTRRKGHEGEPDPRVWINPRIEDPDGETVFEEGCLSFPAIYSKVIRHNRFTAVWQDEFGEEHRQVLDHAAGDFLAIVVQHELDHLDGKLFVDHLNDLQFNQIRKRIRELEDDYRRATGRAGSVIRR